MLWVDAKLGHFRKGQKYFCLQNSFSYSADVKPIVNKNRFKFIWCTQVHEHEHALSMCIL